MIQHYVNKVIFVDDLFLENLGSISRTDLDEFNNPGLDTRVLSLPLRSSEIEEIISNVDSSAIRPGSIVVRPGYTDQFVSVDSFSENLVHRKYGLFGQLCVALGAKKVSVTNIDDVSLEASDDASINAGLSGTAPLGKAEVDLKSKQSNLSDDFRTSIMNIKIEAPGGKPDIETADDLIRKYGLQRDPLFMDILNMRRGANKVSRHELSLDFSTDVKRIFDSSIQAKVKIMSQLYQGKAEFEKVKKSVERARTATKLLVAVEF